MKQATKEKLKSFPYLIPLINKYKRHKAKKKYKWMTKQMHMIDPAHDIRQKYWKKCGVNALGNFNVGYGVYFDATNADHITIEDGVWITSQCLLLCHRRILDEYKIGDDYNKLPYKVENIVLKKGCCIGMRSIVMPGVTIGEGSIVAAGSLITRDIPDWCIAAGRPAKPIKYFDKR